MIKNTNKLYFQRPSECGNKSFGDFRDRIAKQNDIKASNTFKNMDQILHGKHALETEHSSSKNDKMKYFKSEIRSLKAILFQALQKVSLIEVEILNFLQDSQLKESNSHPRMIQDSKIQTFKDSWNIASHPIHQLTKDQNFNMFQSRESPIFPGSPLDLGSCRKQKFNQMMFQELNFFNRNLRKQPNQCLPQHETRNAIKFTYNPNQNCFYNQYSSQSNPILRKEGPYDLKNKKVDDKNIFLTPINQISKYSFEKLNKTQYKSDLYCKTQRIKQHKNHNDSYVISQQRNIIINPHKSNLKN